MKKQIIIVIVLILIIISALIYFNKPQAVACTEDARICPDGTAVVRIPPDCEFEECPATVKCESDNDCIVFGKDGDCNCGCYNLNALPKDSGGACFCAAPTSCKCIDGNCEGIFE